MALYIMWRDFWDPVSVVGLLLVGLGSGGKIQVHDARALGIHVDLLYLII
jgi:hypothetical protein